MGGQLNKSARSTIDPHSEQAKSDTTLSEEPLYVLYGHPADADSARAAQVLERAQVHHCKIGTGVPYVSVRVPPPACGKDRRRSRAVGDSAVSPPPSPGATLARLLGSCESYRVQKRV